MEEQEKYLKRHLVRTIETEFRVDILTEMLFDYIADGDVEKREFLQMDYNKRLKEILKNSPQSYKDLVNDLK